MITNKSLGIPSVTKKKISLSSFLTKGSISTNEMLSNPQEVALLYNFDGSDGTLKAGIGIEEYKTFKIEEGVFPKNLYYYKRYDTLTNTSEDKVVIYATNLKLYTLNLLGESEVTLLIDKEFSTPPVAINYNFFDEDVLILSFDGEGLYMLNNLTLTEIETAPKITSMCIHSERLFATTSNEGTALWFSDDFNPTNWSVSLDEAGYIELPDDRGKLLKVISFLDYIYVFREYGISRIYAYGDQTEFSVDNLFNNIGKIYANTVTECGGYIILLTTSGIYRFNGIDAVKILPFYDKFLEGVDNSDAKGVFYNGKLYLKVNMKFNGKIENVILVYDLESKVPYLAKGLKVDDYILISGNEYKILGISNRKLCVFNNSGKRFSKSLKKVWESGETDFFIETDKKILDKIQITTDEDILLYVICDNKTQIYSVGGGTSLLKLKTKGRNFKFKIISRTKRPNVLKPTFFFSYLKESLW